MSRSVENQRARIVALLVLANLAQDSFLFVANVFVGLANLTNGVTSLFKNVSQGFLNFATTFRLLVADQDRKYHGLTGSPFGPEPKVEVEEEAEVEDDDD